MDSVSTTKQPSEVSKIYLACRNGDIDLVKKYLLTLKQAKYDINPLEPDINSTPLHAACYYGHKEIVKLLLENGCDRSKINRHGLTAYEEAANDDIRQLFKRPQILDCSQRFQDECIDDCFDVVRRPKEDKRETVASITTLPSETKRLSSIQTYQTKAEKQLEIGYATTSIAMCQSKLGRFIADKFNREAPMSLNGIGIRLQDIIDRELIANQDPQSSIANELLNKFLTNNSDDHIKYLIRLYTLETKFYSSLRQNPMPLALPLYIELQTLRDRYFKGLSYRGAKMTDDEIATYEWAIHNRGSLLQTKHFSSTSQNRSVAEDFADAAIETPDNMRKNRVLFIFNFPVECDQAINLSRISDTQPCLSDFEDEHEVLVLPWTLFQVDYVHEDSPSSYTIYLTNVLLPQKNLFSSLKWILRHPKGSLDRFHEYFPRREPDFVVKHPMNRVFKLDQNKVKKNDK
ncbi:unnamed protein product [Rotaria sp. Silwood1]|nr:unnamed protein product [Rotaria sp. Silwood1]CAF1610990.1 unnamed protein product [Rotaria sp. Silwood1]CAF3716541.1 unnamed protein product [Rotaria sp. Silwood1]CAF3771503.1 unnamed protein product [Rotaria sp. Silwood1]CAF4726692.1 unnamed protein product [Rotaria sp. Silwood1]